MLNTGPLWIPGFACCNQGPWISGISYGDIPNFKTHTQRHISFQGPDVKYTILKNILGTN